MCIKLKGEKIMARQLIYFYKRINGVEERFTMSENIKDLTDNNRLDVAPLNNSFRIWATPKESSHNSDPHQ